MIWQLASYHHTNALYKNLFEKIAQKGIEQTVISPRGFPPSARGCNVVQHFGENVWGLPEKFSFNRKIRKYRDLLNKAKQETGNPSLLHAHTLYSDGAAAIQMHYQGVPYVVTVRNTDLYVFTKYYPHLRSLGRKILKNASNVIFVNHNYQTELERLLGCSIPQKKVLVVPNAVDSFWLTGSPSFNATNDNTVRILSVGKVDKNKNHKTLAKTVQTLNKTNDTMKIQLTIVGDYDSPYGKKLKTDFDSEHISLIGKKNKEDIKTLMSQSDIFALVSFRETFGIVYAEALSQNLPVIYTRGQGFDGWTNNTDIAIAVDPLATTELQKAIATLGKRKPDNRAGSMLATELFNWDTVAENLIATYTRT
jgi:glycosyltransferase involved in cell wall biosynthesis